MAVVAAIPMHGPFTTQINNFGNVKKALVRFAKMSFDISIASAGSSQVIIADKSFPELKKSPAPVIATSLTLSSVLDLAKMSVELFSKYIVQSR